MWVRPAYHRDMWPQGDDRRLINLDQYRIIRVVRGDFPKGVGWAVEAVVETTADGAQPSTERRLGPTALLAALPYDSEELATRLFELLQERLLGGHGFMDLSAEISEDKRSRGTSRE